MVMSNSKQILELVEYKKEKNLGGIGIWGMEMRGVRRKNPCCI